jgi:hypothetical protein
MDNINKKVALYSTESSFSHTVSKSGVLVMGQRIIKWCYHGICDNIYTYIE